MKNSNSKRGRGRGRGRRGRGGSQQTERNPSPERRAEENVSDASEPENETQTEGEPEKMRKPRKKPLELTNEQQNDVADWYKDKEYMYNKSHFQYKKTDFKESKWMEKASDLGIANWKDLRTWVESMRTQVGRLTREHNKSGSGRKELTDRDKWIVEKFGFLGPHIARIKTRSATNLKEKIKARHGKTESEDEVSGDVADQVADEESIEDESIGLNEELENEDSSLPKPLPRKKSRQSKAQIKNDLSNEIQEAIRQSKELQEQVKSKLAGPQDSRSLERQNWGQWITSIIPTIDDRIWNRFKRESMDLMERFQTETTELQRRDKVRNETPIHSTPINEKNYCGVSSGMGYLPSWQHQYQLPGQELSQQTGPSRMHQGFAFPETTRSGSAPPSSTGQDIILPTSVSNLQGISSDLNVDSPGSTNSLFQL